MKLSDLPGSGIIKGMAVTARNWLGSYFKTDRMVTVQYPEQRLPLPENTRSFPFLIYDGDDPEAGLRCIACRICEKECPPQAISIVRRRDEKGKPQQHPEHFDIDLTTCMSCQICVEVCPFDALAMDNRHDFVAFERFDAVVLTKSQLARPNTWYHEIKPTEATIVDARREEARQQQEQKQREQQQKRAAKKEDGHGG